MMKQNDAEVFVLALNKTSKRFSYYGSSSIANINLLKLIYKYACYAEEYSTLQRIDEMVNDLQASDPDIPMQLSSDRGYTGAVGTPGNLDDSDSFLTSINKPVVTDFSLDFDVSVYNFSESDFYDNYSDADGDPAGYVTIKTLPLSGTLQYNGSSFSVPFRVENPGLLTYIRVSGVDYSTTFNYSVTDSNCQVPMESDIATVTLNSGDIDSANQPATIGDRAQYVSNRVTTVLTVADFTTKTIAPYFDPENNDLDAIRIDEVSTANIGEFLFLGSAVAKDQIITAAELANGDFVHVGPNSNAITTDSFRASVRDTGSMIWVQ